MKSTLLKTAALGGLLISAIYVSAQEKPRRASSLRLQAAPDSTLATTGDVPYVMPERTASGATASQVGPIGRRRGTPPVVRAGGAIHELPFFANDLPPGHRNYRGKKIHSSSGSQKWGYDLGRMRHDPKSDTWSEVKSSTDWKNPKNSDFYIYGQPVYATGNGKVIRCWRNAPDNPRPFSSALGDSFDEDFEDRDWLHAQWRAKRMSGAGNHLLVEENGGNWILYAHAQPGSISADLCPHHQQLYSKPDADGEADVPAHQQATVQAGQFLFKVGNSGNSSAPHLHLHMQDPDSDPVPFRFRRGLSTPVSGSKADIDQWASFSGKGIPAGPVLFWPPTRLGNEYARHGYPADDFQRLFDHLANSGFWLEWLDAYSVGGKPYLNFIWRPAEDSWKAFFLIDGNRYQDEFDKAVQQGFRPWQVESSLVNGAPRYSVIFRKGLSGGWLARHGLTTAQHDAQLDAAKKQGLSPINVSVLSVGEQRRYTVLYRKQGLGSWQMKSQTLEQSYQALYNQNANAGRRPFYVNAYMHGGKPYITAIFSQHPAGKRKDRHLMSASKYQQEWTSALQAGLLTRTVSSFDGAASQHRFIATWRQ